MSDTLATDSATAVLTLAVTDVGEIVPGVVSLTLGSVDGLPLPGWEPGAHVELRLPNGLIRQYSLCGPESAGDSYRIAILDQGPGSRGGSRYLNADLRVGDTLDVLAVRNSFPLRTSTRTVLIAGGIGITAVLPMAQRLQADGADWELHHAVRHRSSAGLIEALDAGHTGRTDVYVGAEGMRLPLRAIMSDAIDGAAVYVCGPDRMVREAVEAAAELSVTLHVERFTPPDPAQDSTAQSFTAVIDSTGERIVVDAASTLLEALEDNGIDVMSSCRSGICGTCEVGLLAGAADHRDTVLTDDEKSRDDVIIPCISRAVSAELRLDL
ncbi:PDR/VanB family oxidoreductase [Gordonia soli]|uniref:PDR/VanB family oxidoreductase n=1 Tax=Gordonia soli TaxID=320799 RepID=UPI00248036CD|nr:PDR/VanB family oxidoreductase [Gordonia soli]